ncbi:hypothetical protein ABZT27_34855 [Streptomyces sp. NPDC005389]|uniref:hypothetical protein n=1 Tax=Streptomyces sp. NPDC005389 TaxID=3157040 RepID=UPI0033A69A58
MTNSSPLRSLLTWAKQHRLVFRNPTSRVKIGQNAYGMLQPLLPEQVENSVTAATAPAARLVLGARGGPRRRVAQIATLTLGDLDLGNRRLTLAGRARPLDGLPLKLPTDWLGYRRRRWPSTANPPPTDQQPGRHTSGRASNHWISAPMRGQTPPWSGSASTTNSKRPLACGPDLLHLAEVFGFDEETAMRYADSPRALLEQAAEQHLR